MGKVNCFLHSSEAICLKKKKEEGISSVERFSFADGKQ